jgi:hypothetical protein
VSTRIRDVQRFCNNTLASSWVSSMVTDSSDQPIEREEPALEPGKPNIAERCSIFSCALELVSRPFAVYSWDILGFLDACDSIHFDLL